MINELHVFEPGAEPRVFVLPMGKTRIGCSFINEIQVQDAFVSSGSHCELRRDAQGVWLVSYGHTNGQFVNGERQTEDLMRLKVGDVVRIGKAVVIHCVDGSAP